MVPTPDVAAFQLGKEYGNNGQCNPTYFTVGNLVQYLQKREDDGYTKKDLINNFVYVTAGACGPCRFGMYEAEYRLALRNAGFDGFRVILFQQAGGLDQSEFEAGLDMNLDFFLNLINAMNFGDVLNEVGYQIRPFEVNAGETNDVMDIATDELYEVLQKRSPWTAERMLGRAGRSMPAKAAVEYAGKFLEQLFSDTYTSALQQIRSKFDGVTVDRFRVKPIVKITGEFWAQTTEG